MSDDRKFAEECLEAINRYRSHHQVAPLSYNHEIERVARNWVQQMTQRNNFSHNPSCVYNGKKLGENIASQYSSKQVEITGSQIAKQWYDEINDYDFRANRGRGGAVTGHFTQIVWKDSKQIGIARAQARDGTWMVVADFYPPGNYNNDYANNVFPPNDGKIPAPAQTDKEDRHQRDAYRPRPTPQHTDARVVSSSKQTKTSTVNGVKTSTTTETTTDEDGVMKVKVTEKFEHPGASMKVKVTVTTTQPDGSSRTETWTEEEKTTHSQTLPPSTSDKTPKNNDFCRDVVNNHNKCRRNHCDTEDLIINDKLTMLAQSWADHLAKTKSLQHSKMTYEGRPVGESIASKHGTGHVDYSAEEVVTQWYKELEKYDFRHPPDSTGTGTGHFTQIVWKNSKEIGVGKAFSTDNRVYVVALYYPAGNYVGRENYTTNVQPLKHQ